ncbi:MAG: methylenetetrahydrofolate reductase [Clostridia bacterium]|nr:methylenetetrahydrofolate reductase [NAD(P)H] [Clostridia bacterium]
MKISQLLREEKLSLSFEVFPPKSDAGFSAVEAAVREIAALRPSFMSVTYGAGGGTSQYTLDIAKEIKEQFDVPSLAHLTCISSDKSTVHARIEDLKRAGIENVLALRGDIPSGQTQEHYSHLDYRHAVELIRELKASGADFCIGGACYPEVHPESSNQKEDLMHLKEKVDAGCEFLTTQMFFDNNLLYNFLYKLRESGVTVPVIPGIMPITNARQIERALHLSGSFMPRRFWALVDRFGTDPAAMQQAGIAYATDQIIDLYANNVTNVHVYSMNNPQVAKKIMENLSCILGK